MAHKRGGAGVTNCVFLWRGIERSRLYSVNSIEYKKLNVSRKPTNKRKTLKSFFFLAQLCGNHFPYDILHAIFCLPAKHFVRLGRIATTDKDVCWPQ